MVIKKLGLLFLLLFSFLFILHQNIEANWTKKDENPVLKLGESGSWDSQSVGSPFVIREDSSYKMWYEGLTQNQKRIGYATSTNGINWTKYSTFILNSIDNQFNFNVHNPKVVIKDNIYYMWFSASDASINNIHINLIRSEDLTSGGTILINVLYPSLEWELAQNKGVSYPFVLNSTSTFKMWYGAFGIYNNQSAKWRIGYATSTDEGQTWEKHPIPVVDADEDWERVAGDMGVGNPSVLFENGEYHMFYHGDRDIGHAVSYNGTDWTKDPENPVLSPELTNNQAFDRKRVMDPFVLNDAGTYLMYYTGVRNDGKWQIGLATSNVLPTVIPPPENSPTPTPSPTATPTQTPTPTLTPTPTPTLTPTQSPTPTPSPSVTQTPTPSLTPTPTITSSSVIVIVPGFGASWNTRDIFSCNNNTSGDWKLAPFVSVYKPLLKALENEETYLYAYDWRRPLTEQSTALKNYLEKILKGKPISTKIKFIAHSFGGLVVRSFLSDFPSEANVEKVITVGTPHNGMVLAYPLWEKGEVWSDDKIFKITTAQIINHCRIARNPLRFMTAREVIQQVTPSVKDLLPTFDFLQKGNAPILTSGLKNQNDWLNAHGSISQNYLGSLYTLNGKGYNTLRFLDIKDSSMLERKNGDWIDGKPAKKTSVTEGDNTILNLSSQFNGANNEVIHGNHQSIISSQFAVNKILSYLGLPESAITELPIPEITSRDALTISLSLPARLEITDPKRNASSGENISVIYQPLRGLYRIKIEPLESGTAQLHIIYVADGEETKSINYKVNLIKGKIFNYLLPISSFQKPLPQIISIKN